MAIIFLEASRNMSLSKEGSQEFGGCLFHFRTTFCMIGMRRGYYDYCTISYLLEYVFSTFYFHLIVVTECFLEFLYGYLRQVVVCVCV